MDYDLELDKATAKIKKEKAKRVCIQLAEGLKPKAKEIQNALEKSTNAQIFIWAGSCYGACDIPSGLEKLKIDLLIQFGHSEWK